MKPNGSKWKSLIVLAFVMGALLAGCNAEPVDNASMGVAFSSRNAAQVIRETGADTWTYVALGDSVSARFPQRLKEMMEEDLVVSVTCLKRWVNDDHSSALLERIRTDEALRADLRKADFVTIEIPWNVMEAPCRILSGQSDEGCGGLSPEACLERAAEIYQSDTRAILAEIVLLCDPSETLVRTMDTYHFEVAQDKAAGTFDLINRHWRDCNQTVIETSRKYNIPTVRVYDAFMGESGKEDPQASGLLRDPTHPSEKGARLIAQLFREAGYFYAPKE